MSTSARTALVAFAVGTSSFSTALVSWIAKPYVTTIRTLTPTKDSASVGDGPHVAEGAIQLSTRSIFLRERLTNVYDPCFIDSTSRAFAKWQLVGKIVWDPEAALNQTSNPYRRAGCEEVAAETTDDKGNVKGRWLVKWDSATGEEDGILVGNVRQEGQVVT